MRIAFFGLPLAALLLHADGHEIALAAISRPDAPGLRRLRARVGADRVLLRPPVADATLTSRLRALSPDLLVSWFWTTRLPLPLVEAARLGGLGVHPSLLPRHRGPDPTYWTIARGDRETGVTAHRIAADYDTGNIIAQEKLLIDPEWNAWQLARALDRPSLRLLRETVRRFEREGDLPGRPQDPSRATTAPFPEERDLWIEWSWPTARVLRHVRALAPAPGAVTEISGMLVTVLRARAAERWPAVLAPGEGALVDGQPLVRTGDGAVVLLEGTIESDADGAPMPVMADRRTLSALFLP
jgi:methionyl-tRNA formyltransferase